MVIGNFMSPIREGKTKISATAKTTKNTKPSGAIFISEAGENISELTEFAALDYISTSI